MKNLPIRFGWISVLFSLPTVLVLVTACGSAAVTSAIPTDTTSNVVPTSAPVDLPTQAATIASSPSNEQDACTYLTQADVSKVLAVAVDPGTSSGLGGVCTYVSANLKIDLTVTHSGGTQYLANVLANLGNLAVTVPGLGDQAFFNTNSLLVRKGEVAFIFSITDTSYSLQMPDLQAKEQALAEQMFTHLQ